MKLPSLGRAFRIVVSVALAGYLVVGLDWPRVADLVSRAHPGWLVASFMLSPLLALVTTWKWALLLRARGKPLPFGHLFQLYLVGTLFNNVLPSNVGGDIVRAYEAGKALNDQSAALASVFVERFTGLTALIALAAGGLFVRSELFADWRFRLAWSVVLLGYVFVVAAIWFVRVPAGLKQRVPEAARSFVARLARLRQAIRSYSDHPRALVAALLLSLTFYVLAVVNVHVSGLAFGALIPGGTLLAIVPVILVIAMMPISVGGLGLHEWAYVYTFTAVEVGGPEGLLVALLMRLKSVVFGLIGSWFYSRSHPRSDRPVVFPPSREAVDE